ncbi:MAG: ABC transporter substrate-binding protein, partial [Actinobacteria bacterium]|nr:ABC transporter substrate-binding protein [Actinomycetota bacterium]
CAQEEEGGGGESPSGEPIKIGYAGDFSEIYAYYDQPIRDGAQLAIDEINAAGGVLGRPLELVVRDNKNDVALGTRGAQELLDEGIVYMIGSTADSFLAQSQLVCEAGIPTSTGDSTAPTLTQDIPCAYQLVMSDNVQGAVAAEYALAQGYQTAYLLRSEEIPYTANLPTYFSQTFEGGGGAIAGEEQFQIGAGDYSAQVTKIANLDTQPDVIFTPMFIPDTPVFLRQLRQAGVETPVISTDGNHDNALLETGAKALDGFVFSTHAFPAEGTAMAGFYAKYEAATGAEPVSVVVGVGYDEIYALEQAIEAAGSAEPADITAALANVDYTGVSGTIKMNPDTRRAEKEVTLVRMDGDTMTFVGASYPSAVPEP